jgi:MerR family transcriptional regulator, thiopeptide resistance regulator
MQNMKIGDLAKTTGLSVRTLHHYDEINLLKPSGRTDGDHRVYNALDIERLHQIVSLKKLNLSLEEISTTLNAGPTLTSILERHRDLLEEEIKEKQKILGRLLATLELANFNGSPSTENLLASIRELTLFEKIFTTEQIGGVLAKSKTLGRPSVQDLMQELATLVATFKSEMAQDTPANNPEVLRMVQRWIEIRNIFTQGNFDISEDSRRAFMSDPDLERNYGINKELLSYIQKGADALKQQSV